MSTQTPSAEKRVVVESTPAALASSVADRFLTRLRARTRNGRIAHVDHPIGLDGHQAGVVTEHRDHVIDVDSALHQGLSGVGRHP